MALSDYSLEKKTDLTALADSIRAKVESANSMTVAEMKAAIDGMETGGASPTGTETTLPVRLTVSPSLMPLSLPRITMETVSSSRFWAMP